MTNLSKKEQPEIKKSRMRRGVTMIEYGLIAALIGIVCIASVTILGGKSYNMFCSVSVNLSASGNTNSNNNTCYNQGWMNSYNLTSKSTPTQVNNACGNDVWCFAHYYQVKYQNNNVAYLKDIGVGSNESLPLDATDANELSHQYCDSQYATGSSLNQSCWFATATALEDAPQQWVASRNPDNLGTF